LSGDPTGVDQRLAAYLEMAQTEACWHKKTALNSGLEMMIRKGD
jgi:hypothetical protein